MAGLSPCVGESGSTAVRSSSRVRFGSGRLPPGENQLSRSSFDSRAFSIGGMA